jgi:hypothetical protein
MIQHSLPAQLVGGAYSYKKSKNSLTTRMLDQQLLINLLTKAVAD